MAKYVGEGDWRSIAEQASKETDPAKLMTLVENLCCALDGERRQKSELANASSGNDRRSFVGD
jgi:hypothetical protein